MRFSLILLFTISSTSLTLANEKQKEMSFDELLVKGKRHQALESTVTVENDKVLDGLLKIRTDFKDRIQQSANRK